MLLNRETWPLHRRWAMIAVVIAVAAVAWYLWSASVDPTGRWPGGSSLPGLVCGVVGGLIIVFEMLLWPRTWPRVRAWRIGRTRTWMIAHIWLGLLCAPLVVLHHGLAFEWGGLLTVVLMLLFWGVIVSGVVGWRLQHVVPSRLLQEVPAESIASQLPYLARQMATDAQRLLDDATGSLSDDAVRQAGAEPVGVASHVVVGATRSIGNVQGKVLETQSLSDRSLGRADEQPLRNALETTIRPYLLDGSRGSSALARPTAARTYFSGLRAALSEEADPIVDRFEEFCETRRQFEAQARMHRVLHGWLCVHLPLSLALLVLLVAHVISAVHYSGIWPI